MTRHTLSLYDQFDRTFPSTVGFDRAFDILSHAANAISRTDTSFPPYSIIRIDEYNYQLELAVAGFSERNIEVVAEKNKLSVVGVKSEKDDRNYIIKGIAGRSFARDFVLADTIVVREVTLDNGILVIKLENVIPEEQKPRKIAIGRKPVESKPELLVEQGE